MQGHEPDALTGKLVTRFREWRESNQRKRQPPPRFTAEFVVDSHAPDEIAPALVPWKALKQWIMGPVARWRMARIAEATFKAYPYTASVVFPEYTLLAKLRANARMADHDDLLRAPRVVPWIIGAVGIFSATKAHGATTPWRMMRGVYALCMAWHFTSEFCRASYDPVHNLEHQAEHALHLVWDRHSSIQNLNPIHPLHAHFGFWSTRGLYTTQKVEERDGSTSVVANFPPSVPHKSLNASLFSPESTKLALLVDMRTRATTRTMLATLRDVCDKYLDWHESNHNKHRPPLQFPEEPAVDAYILHDIAPPLIPWSTVKEWIMRPEKQWRKAVIAESVSNAVTHANKAKLPEYALLVKMREHARMASHDDRFRAPLVTPWLIGAASTLSAAIAHGETLPWRMACGWYFLCMGWHFAREFRHACYNPTAKLERRAEHALHLIWERNTQPDRLAVHPLHPRPGPDAPSGQYETIVLDDDCAGARVKVTECRYCIRQESDMYTK